MPLQTLGNALRARILRRRLDQSNQYVAERVFCELAHIYALEARDKKPLSRATRPDSLSARVLNLVGSTRAQPSFTHLYPNTQAHLPNGKQTLFNFSSNGRFNS